MKNVKRLLYIWEPHAYKYVEVVGTDNGSKESFLMYATKANISRSSACVRVRDGAGGC